MYRNLREKPKDRDTNQDRYGGSYSSPAKKPYLASPLKHEVTQSIFSPVYRNPYITYTGPTKFGNFEKSPQKFESKYAQRYSENYAYVISPKPYQPENESIRIPVEPVR